MIIMITRPGKFPVVVVVVVVVVEIFIHGAVKATVTNAPQCVTASVVCR